MRTTTQDPSRAQALEIVGNLPTPDYTVNFQPTYNITESLVEAVHELLHTGPVTSFTDIDSIRRSLATERLIAIFGSCHEPVRLTQDLQELETPVIEGLDILGNSRMSHAIAIHRGRGQSTKPRTNGFQTLPSGLEVPSFQGEAVNGQGLLERDADPSRMVASAVQSRDIEEALQLILGGHVPAAHEALLLAFEHSFLRTDPETGKRYLLSGDLPWIGVRTNNPLGHHVMLLSGIENPVGVKLGANTSEEHIKQLTEALNPNREPGKLIFMPRVGLKNMDSLRTIAQAIRKHSENAKVVYDMHGVTYALEDGTKIRDVGDIKKELTLGQTVLGEEGLRWNGLHLETVTDPNRLECIDQAGQLPTHDGDIDPRLNPRQTEEVYNHFADIS